MQRFKPFLNEKLQQLQQFDLLSDVRRPRTYEQLMDMLQNKLNARVLGNGAFSVAFNGAEGGQYVIKTTKRRDDGWLLWGQHCKNNPQPHAPVPWPLSF